MTIIEYWTSGKLRDIWFHDETLPYIERELLSLIGQGCTKFEVIRNDHNYDFNWLTKI